MTFHRTLLLYGCHEHTFRRSRAGRRALLAIPSAHVGPFRGVRLRGAHLRDRLFQVLQLVIGSSAVSLAVLLGTFMGGMCAGSLLLAKYVSQVRHPLDVYARLEGLIGVCGAALIVLMPLVSRLYTAVDGGGQASVALRAIVCVLLLLPPAVLMGPRSRRCRATCRPRRAACPGWGSSTAATSWARWWAA